MGFFVQICRRNSGTGTRSTNFSAMPNLSQKAHAMPASPIRKLVPYSEAAKRAGKTVYHLNIGQPDIETPEVALEAIRRYSEPVIAYSHSAGNESYRDGLARYYRDLGIDVQTEQILITTGGSEALLFAFAACLDPGDEIIVPEPFYANYNGFATSSGITIVPVTSTIDNGFALPPIESFEARITPRTKAILISNPGNPTGCLYGENELRQLRDIVMHHDLYLFADEVYREFSYSSDRAPSILELPGLEGNAVVIDSVSKRYSMCGVRVGALITRNSEVYQAAMKFAQARLSPPSLGQVAGEAALKTGPEYFANVKKEYDARRQTLVSGLNSIDGVRCPMPGGAFYTVAELPVDDAERFCQWILEHFEYENNTVMMAPAAGFYATPGLGQRQVRIAYVLNKEALVKAVEVLRKALEVYPGRLV